MSRICAFELAGQAVDIGAKLAMQDREELYEITPNYYPRHVVT